jgi:APA family basic amino acid/polyamine antiporter
LENQPAGTLVRTLGLRECITITVGTVVGVGLFTVGANCVGLMGGLIILATFAALLISIWPALMYAEMGAALPYAGGTYNYAKKGIGRLWANMAGWNYLIGIIACSSGEALAFSNYFTWIFKAFGLEIDIDPRIIACLVIGIFIFINYRGIKIAARWQNAFMFFFWGCALVWFVIMLPQVNLANFIGADAASMPGIKDFIFILGLVWWCFAGFETAVGMGGEIRHPHINIPRALKLAPFIIFAVTALFQWFLVTLVPPSGYELLASSSAPYAEGLMSVGIIGVPLMILCIGIAFGGDMSTMNPGIAAPTRYLYSMSRDGCCPGILGRLHSKFKTPHIATLVVGVINLALIATNSIIYIASVSLFAILFCYIVGFIAYIGLKVRHKDMARPYKAPAGFVGAIVSIGIYLVLMSQIGTEALITGGALCAASIIFYVLYARRKGRTVSLESSEDYTVAIEEPTADEQKKMNKEYRIWKVISITAFAIAALVFVVPLFI